MRRDNRYVSDLHRAAVRIGHTPEIRARWLLRFAAKELNQLEPDQRAAVGWEVAAYLGLPERQRQGDYVSLPLPYAALAECHEWLRAGIHRLTTQQPWEIRVRRPSSYVVRIGNGPDGRVVPRTPITHGENVFKIRVLEETVPVFLQRFRVCRAGCGRPFILRKRQLYCGLPCSQLERTRRYRQKHPDYLERAHESYARRQRIGRPKVRVRRRPRGRKT